MVHCLFCTLNVIADLYSLGSIKRKTRMKNREKIAVFVLYLLWVKKKRRKGNEGKKWHKGDGWHPAEVFCCPSLSSQGGYCHRSIIECQDI